MREVTQYIANDGTMFTDEGQCIGYEAMSSLIVEAMSALPPAPKDDKCSFANGHGFIQHDGGAVVRARNAVLDIANEYIKSDLATKWIAETKSGERHISHCGRLFDDFGNRAISHAWGRFQCIDKMNREWGQPYYAANPNEAEQICLTPANQTDHSGEDGRE